MAFVARQLQRRLSQALLHFHPRSSVTLLLKDGTTTTPTYALPSPRNSLFSLPRGIETKSGENDDSAAAAVTKTPEEKEYGNVMVVNEQRNFVVKFTHDLCLTKLVRTTDKKAFETGTVLARCDGCNAVFCISDHLGWVSLMGSAERVRISLKELSGHSELLEIGSDDTLDIKVERKDTKKWMGPRGFKVIDLSD